MTRNILSDLTQKIDSKEEQALFSKVELEPLRDISVDLNQFLLLVKPEILKATNKEIIHQRMEILLNTLKQNDVVAHRAALFNGLYANEKTIPQGIYPTLNKVSQKGLDGCHPSAKKELLNFLDSHKLEIMGGHQFLEKFKNYSSTSLREENDLVGASKFGSGVYGVKLQVDEEQILVLNAFFPHMVKDFSINSAHFLGINCSSYKEWDFLREGLVGYINPEVAEIGSLRNVFNKLDKELRPEIFDISHNGFHISPGPLEATEQLKTIFGNDLYNFEQLLSQNLLNDSKITSHNAEIHEKTENLSTKKALDYLMKLSKEIE